MTVIKQKTNISINQCTQVGNLISECKQSIFKENNNKKLNQPQSFIKKLFHVINMPVYTYLHVEIN